MVETASGSGKMKGDLHRMTHFFLLRQAPPTAHLLLSGRKRTRQDSHSSGSKVINPLLLAEETDRYRKQAYESQS